MPSGVEGGEVQGADEVPEGSAVADSTRTFAAGPSARAWGAGGGGMPYMGASRRRRKKTHAAERLNTVHLLIGAKS